MSCIFWDRHVDRDVSVTSLRWLITCSTRLCLNWFKSFVYPKNTLVILEVITSFIQILFENKGKWQHHYLPLLVTPQSHCCVYCSRRGVKKKWRGSSFFQHAKQNKSDSSIQETVCLQTLFSAQKTSFLETKKVKKMETFFQFVAFFQLQLHI